MASFKISKFGGVVPRTNPTLIQDNMATTAQNVRLWHGTIAPFRTPNLVHTAPIDCVRSFYYFNCCWLTWEGCCVDVAEWLPDCKRIYVTGAGEYPQVAHALGKGCALEWKRVGLPVPTQPPVATVTDTTKPERVTSSRIYFYTYVDSFGGEGCPSPPSDEILDVSEASDATIVIPGIPLNQFWDIKKIRLYRIAEGFNDGRAPGYVKQTSVGMFVDELDPLVASQTYVDKKRLDDLMEVNISEQFTPPPENLVNITQLPNGVLAGSVENRVLFSEPYQPHAWPVDYELHLDDNVCALKWQEGILYAMTDGYPYAIADASVDINTTARWVYRFPQPAPILSHYSATVAPGGVIYASDEGLIYLSQHSISRSMRMMPSMTVITAPWFAKDDWLARRPETMISAFTEGQYIGFTCKGGILFDLRDNNNDGVAATDLVTLDLTPGALHTTRSGHLYLAFGNTIQQWDAGNTYLPYHWKSKKLYSPGWTNWGAMKITLDSYSNPKLAPTEVRMRFYTDNRLLFDRTVSTSRPFRLPAKCKNFDFEIEVIGQEVIREIHLATSMMELAS